MERRQFNRAAILNLNDSEFSAADKRYLLNRFFPEVDQPRWKCDLKAKWGDTKRWRAFFQNSAPAESSNPFHLIHPLIVALAQTAPPCLARTRVTDFSDWIFSLYMKPPAVRHLAQGRYVEQKLLDLVPVPSNKQWDLVHKGIGPGIHNIKLASRLTVQGVPLRGVPDLVFRERGSGRVLLVELKASNRVIPTDGWPNLRAQLWAYRHIDDWVDAPDIALIGEVWGFTADRIFLRRTVRWTANDREFDAQNRELFELYGGVRRI